MKLVIFGSRTIPFEAGLVAIGDALGSKLCEVTEEINGTATGADTIGAIWARTHGIPVTDFPPDPAHGFPAALFIRNTEMAEYCDAGLGLWDGESRGTLHMVSQLKRFGKPYKLITVRLVPEPPEPVGLEKFFE